MSRTRSALLWAVQLLVAGAFLLAGMSKLRPDLSGGFDPLPLGLVRLIGVCEVVGALAVLAGSASGRPRISAVAAAALAAVMMLAAGFHLGRGEFNALPVNAVLCLAAGLIAWRRLRGHARALRVHGDRHLPIARS